MDQLKRHNKESGLHKVRLFIPFSLLHQMQLITNSFLFLFFSLYIAL